MTGMTPREVRRCRYVASVDDCMFVYHIHKINSKLAIDGECSIGKNVVTQMSYIQVVCYNKNGIDEYIHHYTVQVGVLACTVCICTVHTYVCVHV